MFKRMCSASGARERNLNETIYPYMIFNSLLELNSFFEQIGNTKHRQKLNNLGLQAGGTSKIYQKGFSPDVPTQHDCRTLAHLEIKAKKPYFCEK